MYYPSTYIKYWWYPIRLNTQDIKDNLLILFVSISYCYKVSEIIKKQHYKK